MKQRTLLHAVTNAGEKSKSLLTAQLEKQMRAWGATVSQTARDLEDVGAQLRKSQTINGGAPLALWVADYVDLAGKYLADGDAERFIADIERFARRHPWTLAASAAALGYGGARVVKSSSARRLRGLDHSKRYAGGT